MRNNYETQDQLKNLGNKLRQQTFWGLTLETTKWDVLELGEYILPSSLPSFLAKIQVWDNVMSFKIVEQNIFDRHETIYKFSESPSLFIAKLERLLASQTEEEFRQNLLAVLQTEVNFVSERDL